MELVVGAILEGKVTGITKFGAFIALPGGKSGLVHISNISNSYVNDINEFLSVGQDVKVKVMNIDQNNRINLSIKHALPPDHKNTGGHPSSPHDHGGERDRSGFRSHPSSNNFHGGSGSAPRGPGRTRNSSSGNSRFASREPQTFEDKLKQYMAESESKLSELNRNNDRGRSRRGRRGN